MLDFVLVGGGQMGAHGAVMVCENDAAATGWGRWVKAVFDSETGFGAGFAQDVGVFVRANATDEEDGGRGEDVLFLCRERKKKKGKWDGSNLGVWVFLIWKKGRGGFVYLSTTSGVLGCSTSDKFGIVVVEEFVVEAHVLLLGENRIIGLEPVFLE